MSEAKFFPLKKFLVVNRGEEIPDGVTLLRYGKRELAVKHANSREARLELQYMAKQLGANSLINVHVEYFYDAGGSTRYKAYGTPAVCGRMHPEGTMTADELRSQFHMPPPPPPRRPQQAPQSTSSGKDFWHYPKLIAKIVGIYLMLVGLAHLLN